MTRLIAIGDIHGEIKKLDSLLDKLCLEESDTVIFLGDYIDRGPNPKEVIEKLLQLSNQINCVFLKGNHEDMLLKLLETKKEEDIEHWLLSGGISTFDNYGGFPQIFHTHRDFFENLKPYYVTDKYFFSHAGINPNKQISEQNDDDLYWIREEFIGFEHNLDKTVVFGHTPFTEPYIEHNKIGIDTGCGKIDDGKLTAIICDTKTFIQSE